MEYNNSMERICWVCMKQVDDLNNLKDISGYTFLIKNLSKIEILQDDLIPTKICQNCVLMLVVSNLFRLNIIKSQHNWTDFVNEQQNFIKVSDNYNQHSAMLCRICLEDVNEETNQVSSVYLLPKKIKEFFLSIRDYERHPSIPEKLCTKCFTDMQISYKILKACEMMQLFAINEGQCLICQKDSTNNYFEINKLSALILSFVNIPDQKTIDIIENSELCNDCIKSLIVAKELRYTSFKSEEVLKLQFEQYLQMSNDIEYDYNRTMDVEYLDDYSSIDTKIDEKLDIRIEGSLSEQYENIDSISVDDSDQEVDFLSLQLNTPPVQTVFKCSQCSVSYSHEPDLLIHYDIMHSTKGTLCTECGLKCKSIASLRHHKIRIHYKVLDHICEICGRQFPGKAKYQAHFVTHFDERNVPCQMCLARFKTKKALNLHMRCHTGEKPYSCEVCQKKFSHYSDKKRHTYTHTDERPYNCEICQKGFVKKNLLRNHMQQHEKATGKEKLKMSTLKN